MSNESSVAGSGGNIVDSVIGNYYFSGGRASWYGKQYGR